MRSRIVANYRPALLWVTVLFAIVAFEAGAIFNLLVEILQGLVSVNPFGNPFAEQVASAKSVSESIPTLLSRRRSRTRVADERERPLGGDLPRPRADGRLAPQVPAHVRVRGCDRRLVRLRLPPLPQTLPARRLDADRRRRPAAQLPLLGQVRPRRRAGVPRHGPVRADAGPDHLGTEHREPLQLHDETLRRGVRVRRGDIRRRRQQRVGVTGEPGTTTSAPGRTTTSGGSIRSGRYRTERTCSRSWCTALASRCSSD